MRADGPVPPPESEDLPRPVVRGGRFFNPGHHLDRTWLEVMRWKLTSRAARWPAADSSASTSPTLPRPAPPSPASGLAATWIGHASFLLRTPSHAVLIDPVWSGRIGLFGRIGPRRAAPPGVSIESLPPIDAILLSHDHYDHCDLPTLRRLAREHPQARLFAPLGFASLAARAGFGADRVTLLDWWQSNELPPASAPASDSVSGSSLPAPRSSLRLTATPARHWGNRLSGARNQRLWCGWHLATPEASVHFAGDTALDEDMFSAIRLRLGPPDLALLPIGAYAPRWFMNEQHCDPAEAVRLHLALGARQSLGMHWGTFALTDEPRDEPPRLLAEAVRAAGLPPSAFITVGPSETVATCPG